MSEYRTTHAISVPQSLLVRYRKIADSHGFPLSRVIELAMIQAEEGLVTMLDQIVKKKPQPQTVASQPTAQSPQASQA